MLAFDGQTRQARYDGGSGSRTLTFRYVVEDGDDGTQGITVAANTLSLNGGGISSVNGGSVSLQSTNLSASSNDRVDGDLYYPPTPTAVRIVSSPLNGNRYDAAEVIEIEVEFSEVVSVTGEPSLVLTIGGQARQAVYEGGDGTRTLTFGYVVADSDQDTDGISFAAEALSLNGGSILDADGHAAAAVSGNLMDAALADAGHPRVGAAPVTVEGISIVSSPEDNSTYGRFEMIVIKIVFSEEVTVSGVPSIELAIGGQTQQATYESGSGTKTLRFHYAVEEADDSTQGITVTADALSLNGGNIASLDGDDVSLQNTGLSDTSDANVDGDTYLPPAPTAVRIVSSPLLGNNYNPGDAIEIEVDFGKVVFVAGSPSLALTIGGQTRQAVYYSGGGTRTLTFNYVAAGSDRDADGISFAANPLSLNGGSIADAHGNPTGPMPNNLVGAALAAAGYPRVGVPPITVSGISIVSTPEENDTYGRAETILVEVIFSGAVTVTGAPNLALTIGGQTRQATYASGSGTRTLRFGYVVDAADAGTAGITIAANALSPNGGGIEGIGGNEILLNNDGHTVTNAVGHHVDGSIYRPPTPTAVRIVSNPLLGNNYGPTETIAIEVDFSEVVFVAGTPSLALIIGGQTRQAAYESGDGTGTLTFNYVATGSDRDANGISFAANPLSLNGGLISDTGGNPAGPVSNNLIDTALAEAGHPRVGVPPITVTGMSIVSAPEDNNAYARSETILVEVHFSSDVTVTGAPSITLTIGGQARRATYASRSGTRSLRFRYVVDAADRSTTGITIAANALSLNGGGINGTNGNEVLLNNNNHTVTNAVGHLVDGGIYRPPTPTAVRIVSRPLLGNNYDPTEAIRIAVDFSEVVFVAGRPSISLVIGGQLREAFYESGGGTRTLVFSYVAAVPDRDADGISFASSALSLSEGSISDADGNAARPVSNNLIIAALAEAGYPKVGTPPITVTGMSIVSTPEANGIYGRTESILVDVRFSSWITISGTPSLALAIGGQMRQAMYESGDGTQTLRFGYVVGATDEDSTGITVAANALSLNGGGIAGVDGNEVLLNNDGHTITNAVGHRVDGGIYRPPTPTAVRIISSPLLGNSYGAAETIEIAIDFSEVVTATGAPSLALVIGEQARQAVYESGGGTRTLTFGYIVVDSDLDTDGISFATNALSLNGGSISDTDGNPAGPVPDNLTIAAPTEAGHPRVGVPPITVTGISIVSTPEADGIYGRTETIIVEVTFSKEVVVTGLPAITLNIGNGGQRWPRYESGSGTKILRFHHVVSLWDRSTQGITTGTFLMQGSSIVGLNGGGVLLHETGPSATSSDNMDGRIYRPPTPTAVRIVSSPLLTHNYHPMESIEIEVDFSEVVIVTGKPSLGLDIGGRARQAVYGSGNGTRTLAFSYVVADSDQDTDGISFAANVPSLNGGSILDSDGNAAVSVSSDLTDAALAEAGHPRVGIPPITIEGISIVSTPEFDGIYGRSEAILVEVIFSGHVTVTGTPTLTLGIGGQTRQATYESGSGTRMLRFRYVIAAADGSTQGITIAANALSVNGGYILDANNNGASLTNDGHTITHAAGHNVDGSTFRPPTSTNVRIVSSPLRSDTYGATESIEIEVEFSETVTVTGRPSLALDIGGQTQQAFYEGGGGTSTLAFGYVVKDNDQDANGLTFASNVVSLNGGSVSDSDGNGLQAIPNGLTSAALTEAGNPKVDGSVDHPPTVVDVRITSNPLREDVYGVTELIEVDVVFSESVVVGGSPALNLEIGSTVRSVAYKTEYSDDDTQVNSGAAPVGLSTYLLSYLQTRPTLYSKNNQSLTFIYIVDASDSDTDGISIAVNALSLAGGKIFDAGGNNAELNLGDHAIDSAVGHKVNGTIDRPPFVTRMTIVSKPQMGDTYGAYENIEVELEFSESVQIKSSAGFPSRRGATSSTGHPSIDVTLESPTEPWILEIVYKARLDRLYSSVHRFTTGEDVVPTMSGVDQDGVSILANALTLNGGTIQDINDNNAELDLSDHVVTNAPDHKVDTNSSIAYVKPRHIATRKFLGTYGHENYPNDDNGIFRRGDGLGFAITLREPLNSNITILGNPTLTFQMGSDIRQAKFAAPSPFFRDSIKLRFWHRITTNDFSPNGVRPIEIEGGTILDQHNREIKVVLEEILIIVEVLGNNDSAYMRDALFWTHHPDWYPKVNYYNNTTLFRDYAFDEPIIIAVRATEPVSVTGTPLLELTIGSKTRFAEYRTNRDYSELGLGDGSFLFFSYTVHPSDLQQDTLRASRAALTMNGGTITTASGKELHTLLPVYGIVNDTGILSRRGDLLINDHVFSLYQGGVKGGLIRNTELSWIVVAPKPLGDGTIHLGEHIYVWVYFSKEIRVTQATDVSLTIGTEKRRATLHETDTTLHGTGLLFRYTVTSSDFGRIRVSDNPINGILTDSSGTPIQVEYVFDRLIDGDFFADGSEDGDGGNTNANLSDDTAITTTLPSDLISHELSESIFQRFHGFTCEATTSGDASNQPNAIMSDTPTTGTAPFQVTLDGSRSTGSNGSEITDYHWFLNGSLLSPNEPGPFDLTLPPGRNGILLDIIDERGKSHCVEKIVTVGIGDGSAYDFDIYDDRLVTVDITQIEDLNEDRGRRGYGGHFFHHLSNVVYTYLEDDFDFIIYVSNLIYGQPPLDQSRYRAVYFAVQNNISGLGPSDGPHSGLFDLTSAHGSNENLQGIIHLTSWHTIITDDLLHEIMHRWGNSMIPVAEDSWRGHWGLSSVYGYLGGFDLRYLQRARRYDDIDGAPAYEITDGGFSPVHSHNPSRLDSYISAYGQLELYLMGLIPIDEVPTIWAATERLPVYMGLSSSRFIHIVQKWKAYDKNRILREFGPRNPPYGQAQTAFKAVVVLMVADGYPSTAQRLEDISEHIRQFSMPGDDGFNGQPNFWEATGGRATIELDRLSLSRKAIPTPPTRATPPAQSLGQMRSLQGFGGPVH